MDYKVERPPVDFEALNRTVSKGRRFLLVSHINPDGDAAGSSCAMYLHLIKSGKSADIVNISGWNPVFRTFVTKDKVLTSLPDPGTYDAVIVLDCTDPVRTGFHSDMRNIAETLVNIDHHITNEYFGDINIVDEDAKATSEIIFDWLVSMDSLTKETAAPLLFGFITDSALFQAASLDAAFFRKISVMLSQGLSYSETLSTVLYQGSFNQVGILTDALKSLKHSPSEKILWTCYCTKSLKKHSCTGEDVLHTGIFTHLLSVKSVKIACVFIHTARNSTHVEFRSKDDINVAEIATDLGGGGHLNASGCQLKMNVRDSIAVVLDTIRKRHPGLWQESREL